MDYDIVIVGGGLAGLSLAVALRRSRYRIALIESRAPLRPEGWDVRIYAISPANARFLDEIGIWPHLLLGDCFLGPALRPCRRAGVGGG